jgi:hypothetical protein
MPITPLVLDQPWRFAIEASKNYIAVISQVNRLL